MEQTHGLPVLSIIPNRSALDRYDLNISDVQNVIQIALGGKSIDDLN